MKKFTALLGAMMVSVSAIASTTFTFTSASSANQKSGGYTVALAKGSGNNEPAYYDSNGMRLYANNTITISGSGITSVDITFAKQGSKDYATLSASTGNLVSGGVSTSATDLVTDRWTGNASSVTFTLGGSGQRLISSIVINGDGSETPGGPSEPGTPDTPDTPSTLDPSFVYPEPTVLTAPALTVQGDSYSFVENNVEVKCTRGAVNQNYFSAHAGFEMTFTATRAIKGIVINGFVKKDFEASVNHGQISYLTPSEDEEANPVVVITDIDATSVTISCVKQLRCYEVELYFDENPEATVSGGVTGDTEEDLDYDSADAVYESAFTEMLGEDNYSIFLYNASDPEYKYFALDLYPDNSDLTGYYSTDDYTLGFYTYYSYGEGEDDMSYAYEGQVEISKNGKIYTIEGSILCENNVIYNIHFTGEMPFYTDDEYYGSGEEPGDDKEEDLEFDTGEAVYESAWVEMIGEENYSIFLYNAADPEYRYFALDIYPEKKDVLEGEYSFDDWTLGDYTYYSYGAGDDDLTWALDGMVEITRKGDIYSIYGIIYCDNGVTYNISFTGELPIYTDDEYYDDGTSSVGAIEEATAGNGIKYDLQGRRVGDDYRGIYILNGKKYVGR